MRSLTLQPHAKINLGLRILGVRDDGYHELRTRFQTIDLTDELELQLEQNQLSLTIEGADLPADDTNLVLRAAKMLRAQRPGLPGARMHLRKRIPLAAGLGGGSSDAAATLLGLNRLWELDLPRENLARLGSELGADIGFFFVGGSALGLGKGDEIRPLLDCAPMEIALLLSPVKSSTAEVYRLWDADHRAQAGPVAPAWDPDSDPEREPSARSVHNDLEDLVLRTYPPLADLKRSLLGAGSYATALSGSGPSLYGLFRFREDVRHVGKELAQGSARVVPSEPVGRDRYWERLGLPLSA
jgi:4-diphosphocytidyl-2-C-methyl-D-erythritol kinase